MFQLFLKAQYTVVPVPINHEGIDLMLRRCFDFPFRPAQIFFAVITPERDTLEIDVLRTMV